MAGILAELAKRRGRDAAVIGFMLGGLMVCSVSPAPAARLDSYTFLNIGPSARAAAMGEAFTGLADDVSTIFWNPAGLGNLRHPQILLMHDQWFQDILAEHAAVSLPLSAGGFGLAANYISYGTLDKVDALGQPAGTFSAMDASVTAAYGIGLADHWAGGVALKVPFSNINGDQTAALLADAGLLLSVPGFEVMQFGLTAVNLFDAAAGAAPFQLRLGAGLVEPIPGLRAGVDWIRRTSDAVSQVNLGAEYVVAEILIPRIGYQYSSADVASGGARGMTAGLGVRSSTPMLSVEFDYAYVPFGDLGDVHRLDVVLDFGPPKSGAREQPPEAKVAAPAPAETPVASPAKIAPAAKASSASSPAPSGSVQSAARVAAPASSPAPSGSIQGAALVVAPAVHASAAPELQVAIATPMPTATPVPTPPPRQTLMFTEISATDAFNGAPQSAAPSQDSSSEPPAALRPPENVNLKASGKKIILAWTDSPSPQRAGYAILMKTDGGVFRKVHTAASKATSYTTKALKPRHTYWFTIRTLDHEGHASSGTNSDALWLK